MEPAFQRGDLLFLWNRNLGMNQLAGPPVAPQAEFSRTTEVGEIVVYNVKGKEIPIVHRVVRKHKGAYVFLPPYICCICAGFPRRLMRMDGMF